MLFLCEDEDFSRFSYLHLCTFNNSFNSKEKLNYIFPWCTKKPKCGKPGKFNRFFRSRNIHWYLKELLTIAKKSNKFDTSLLYFQ